MSDIFTAYDLSKFKQVSISSDHCLNYVIRDAIADNEIAFTVNIPYEQLRSCAMFGIKIKLRNQAFFLLPRLGLGCKQ